MKCRRFIRKRRRKALKRLRDWISTGCRGPMPEVQDGRGITLYRQIMEIPSQNWYRCFEVVGPARVR